MIVVFVSILVVVGIIIYCWISGLNSEIDRLRPIAREAEALRDCKRELDQLKNKTSASSDVPSVSAESGRDATDASSRPRSPRPSSNKDYEKKYYDLLSSYEKIKQRLLSCESEIQSKNSEISKLSFQVSYYDRLKISEKQILEEKNKLKARAERDQKRNEKELAEINRARSDLDDVRLQFYSEDCRIFGSDVDTYLSEFVFSPSFISSVSADFSFHSPVLVSCDIKSSDNVYHTTLTSCTCQSYEFSHKPCKHMLWLATRMGVVLSNATKQTDAVNRIAKKSEELYHQEHIIDQKLSTIQKKEEKIENQLQVIKEKRQTYPWLSSLLSKYHDDLDTVRLARLSVRAKKSAEILSDIRREKAALLKERNLLFNQITVYEAMFPWLEEFKDIPTDEAVEYLKSSDSESSSDYSYLKKYISPSDYAQLSMTEKLQKALDNYQHKRKNDWQVGIEYERYIGYLYETKGYSVEYSGAIKGVEDMGRDIIAKKDGRIEVVQCKRWSQNKQIHEKHIFQLYGTTILLKANQNKPSDIIPVFYCTTSLSETAQKCADILGVKVFSDFPLSDYPVIKCNINKTTGERIFHLPFDQQYDRVSITPNSGEFYASTVADAEAHGFRHAFKHHISDSN